VVLKLDACARRRREGQQGERVELDFLGGEVAQGSEQKTGRSSSQTLSAESSHLRECTYM